MFQVVSKNHPIYPPSPSPLLPFWLRAWYSSICRQTSTFCIQKSKLTRIKKLQIWKVCLRRQIQIMIEFYSAAAAVARVHKGWHLQAQHVPWDVITFAAFSFDVAEHQAISISEYRCLEYKLKLISKVSSLGDLRCRRTKWNVPRLSDATQQKSW